MTAFLLDALAAALPFLLASIVLVLYLLVATLVRAWWERGVRRRQERLWSTDPKRITDREIESLR